MHQQFLNAGIEFDFYKNTCHHFIVGMGYKYAHLDFKRSPFVSTGVHTHWFTVDTKYQYRYAEAGLKFGTFLHGNVKSVSVSDVTGVTPDCYNRFYVAPFIGLVYPFQRLKFGALVGIYAVPMLDADRVASANLIDTEVNLFFFEVGISYRLFSTRKYSKSIHPFIQ